MQIGTVSRLDFAGDLEDSKSTSGGTLCFFESHTFVPISWMCKKQTSVSHSQQNLKLSLLIQVYAWMEFPLSTFGIWLLHSSSNQPEKSKENVQGNLLRDRPSRKHTNNHVKTPIQYNDLELCNVDYVSSNVKSFRTTVRRSSLLQGRKRN